MKRYKDIKGDGGSNIAGQVEAQQAKLRARLASVRHVVAILSGKGGVGKSAITANLACCFALDGWKVMSMDLLLPSDAAPLAWDAPTQAEAHTWRGAMEANALREFLADTRWGELEVLLLDLPPGTDRLATVASPVPALAGGGGVTIPSEVAHLVVRKAITAAGCAVGSWAAGV